MIIAEDGTRVITVTVRICRSCHYWPLQKVVRNTCPRCGVREVDPAHGWGEKTQIVRPYTPISGIDVPERLQ